MLRYIIGATTLSMLAATASANEISLTTPMNAGVLNEDRLDMVVYYLDTEAGVDVVATYVAHETPGSPQRLIMSLENGAEVTFGLPGHPGTVFRFAYNASGVTVESTSTQPNVTQAY